MGSKGDKSKTKYGAEGADGDAPDVETAAFTTKGSVTPNAAVEAKNSGSTGQNPWTSPTAVIFLIAFALAGYVCWIYSDQPAVGPAPKPEPAKKAPKKAAAAAAEEDDLETFLALPTLILFWVVTYAVLNEEEED